MDHCAPYPPVGSLRGAADRVARESLPVARLRRYADLGEREAGVLESLLSRRVRAVSSRADLAPEGAPTDRVHFVLRGWACRYKVLEDGRRQIVSVLLPGDACCLDEYLPVHLDHAIAPLSRLTFAEVPRDDILAAVRACPGLGDAFGWAESLTRAIQRQWTVNLGRRTASEKIAHLLCELHHRLDAVGYAVAGSFETHLSQVDMADALGLSTVHVNRTVRDLREAGLIQLDTRRVAILDHEALARMAQFDPAYLEAPVRGPGRAAGLS